MLIIDQRDGDGRCRDERDPSGSCRRTPTGEVADEQAAALLMAIVFRGLDLA